MAGFILGEKSEQSQTFSEDGIRIPVTLVKTQDCYLIDLRTPDRNGYIAIKLGFKTGKNVKKPVKGETEKAGIKTPLRFLKEFRLEKYDNAVKVIEEGGKKGIQIGETKIFVGEKLNPVVLFQKGDKVDVSGTSKGKGFQGVVKRHGFHGGPRTHGQSDRERAPGSIGQTTTPGRVYKGKRMAGRMGGVRVTVRGLKVIDVNEEGLTLKGLVPGTKKGFLEIRSSIKSPHSKV